MMEDIIAAGQRPEEDEAEFTLALLKAVAEKLIPGIPIETRISILQQTSVNEASNADGSEPKVSSSTEHLSVFETVIDRATSRNEIQHEIDGSQIRFPILKSCD